MDDAIVDMLRMGDIIELPERTGTFKWVVTGYRNSKEGEIVAVLIEPAE